MKKSTKFGVIATVFALAGLAAEYFAGKTAEDKLDSVMAELDTMDGEPPTTGTNVDLEEPEEHDIFRALKEEEEEEEN